jgi:hypothetical protein
MNKKLVAISLAVALTVMPLTVHATGKGPRCNIFQEPVTIIVESVPHMECQNFWLIGQRCSTIVYAGKYYAMLYTRNNLTGQAIEIQGCADNSGKVSRVTITK